MANSLRLMVFYLTKECETNKSGVVRIVDLDTKQTIGCYKVPRMLDTFLYLQDRLSEYFPKCTVGVPDSPQCFGVYWKNNQWLGHDCERTLCKHELRYFVEEYVTLQSLTVGRK